jgi:hypothetical protein
LIFKKYLAVLLTLFILLGELIFFQGNVKAEADTTAPQLKSISIDKTSVVAGEGIKITVEATDNGGSGIQYIYVNYKTPITKKSKYIQLNHISGDTFEGTVMLSSTDESGIWKISTVELKDNLNNYIAIYNSIDYNMPNEQDFSNCNFELKELNITISPQPQKCVTQNEYWTGNTIDGDLYIGPQAVLTINGSVTVNGNIYVLGAVKNYGNLTVTGGIYARQFIWGSSTLYNGTVLMLGGTNSVGSIVASNAPIDIPFKIYEANNNTLVAFDGKISITGATLPIIDLYMDSVKVNYYYNGTFSLDLDTNNKQQVAFKTVDVFGNEKINSYTILNKYYDTNTDSAVNIIDLANVAKGYNAKKSDVNWQEQYDYNCDEVIDIYDLVKISTKIS